MSHTPRKAGYNVMGDNEQNAIPADPLSSDLMNFQFDPIDSTSGLSLLDQSLIIEPEENDTPISAATTAPIPVVSVPGFPGMVMPATETTAPASDELASGTQEAAQFDGADAKLGTYEDELAPLDGQWPFDQDYDSRPAPKRSKAPIIAGIAAVLVIGAVMAGAVILHPQDASSGARAVIPESSSSASAKSSESAAASSSAAAVPAAAATPAAPSSEAAPEAEQAAEPAPQSANTTPSVSQGTSYDGGGSQPDYGTPEPEPQGGGEAAPAAEETPSPSGSGWIGWDEFYQRYADELADDSGSGGGNTDSGNGGGSGGESSAE